MNNYIIYGLFDPVDNELRYIGCTSRDINLRLKEHLKKTELTRDFPRCRWIKKLISYGLLPIIKVLETTGDEISMFAAETKWIKGSKWKGNLLNCSDGGEGMVNMSREIKDKIGIANSKKIRTEEQKEFLRNLQKGNKQSEETKLKRIKNMTGKVNLGNKHGEFNRKLMDSQIENINIMRASGLSALKVSKIIGCSESTVWRVFNKRLSYLRGNNELVS